MASSFNFIDRLRNFFFGPRRDLVRYRIMENADLVVYWKVLKIGKGPAAALYVFGREVLRFDCFGENGHFHARLDEAEKGRVDRRFFNERTVPEQIERSSKELTCNLHCYMAASKDPRIRDVEINRESLENAAFWMKARMNEYARGKAAQVNKARL
jgi:hypothetical protein